MINIQDLLIEMSSYNMQVYEKVRQYLYKYGMKQAAIAEKSGICKTGFNDIINCKADNMLKREKL